MIKSVYPAGLVAGLVGALDFQGDYDASTNTPDLDTSPSGISQGYVYMVSVAGTFFTENVQVGDMLVAKQDSPTTLAHWIVVNSNITDQDIRVNSVLLNEISTPTATPDKGQMWTETDDLIHFFNGAGTEITIGTEQFVTAPTTDTDPGVKGQVAFSGSYVYFCVATNTWVRYAVETSF